VAPPHRQRHRRRSGFYRGLTEALLEVARAHFALSKPGKDGKSRLQVLLEIRKQTGVVAQELRDIPEFPDETAHIWRWFNQISRRRQAGFNMEALSWQDIDSFFRRMKLDPQGWELDALCELDDAFLSSRFDDKAGTVKSAKALRATRKDEPDEKRAVGRAGARDGVPAVGAVPGKHPTGQGEVAGAVRDRALP
jgi:hypothetical protein